MYKDERAKDIKAIILCTLLLCLNWGVSEAAIPAEVSDLLSRCEGLDLKIEQGMQRKQFVFMYKQIRFDLESLAMTDAAYKNEVQEVQEVYRDIDDIWAYHVTGEFLLLTDDLVLVKRLKTRYPDLLGGKVKTIRDDKFNSNYWNTMEVIAVLPTYADNIIGQIRLK